MSTTTIYVPTPITSAEQAEALPIGTVSISDHPDDKPSVKVTPTLWVCVWDVDDDHDATYAVAPISHMLGDFALVPIEAEEERARSQINITHLSPPAPQMVPVRLPCPRCGLR
ncbi:hypothetical protein HBA56_04310 [Pseudoteredinibacter isoporae]|nr:hypothetical protein [Pseudoteredinibacter isoporae]